MLFRSVSQSRYGSAKKDRKIKIQIDKYDTWSMDHTLALIIHPMLIQLKASKVGAPYTDDEDVPEHLRSTAAPPKQDEYSTDDNHFDRWDWILDEMIWAFEQKVINDAEGQFFDHSESEGKMPWDENYVGPKVDWDGLHAHNERKRNAFRLFGKYYENLWD